MSLVRIALRIAVIEALKGRTLVAGNVLDSQIAAIAVAGDGSIRTDQDRPFIAVYTDRAKVEPGTEPRSLIENGLTELHLEMGIAASMTMTGENGESVVVEGIPATDSGFEFTLDLVARQIADVLSDPENSWAEVYRLLVNRVARVERSRAASDTIGVRMAGHQITLLLDLVDDPLPGQPIEGTSAFGMFLALADASDDELLVQRAALMRGQIEDGQFAQAARRLLGLTDGEALVLGVEPSDPEAADLGELILSVEGL